MPKEEKRSSTQVFKRKKEKHQPLFSRSTRSETSIRSTVTSSQKHLPFQIIGYPAKLVFSCWPCLFKRSFLHMNNLVKEALPGTTCCLITFKSAPLCFKNRGQILMYWNHHSPKQAGVKCRKFHSPCGLQIPPTWQQMSSLCKLKAYEM